MFDNFKRKKINNRRFLNQKQIINENNINESPINNINNSSKQLQIIRIIAIILIIGLFIFGYIYKGYYDFKNKTLIKESKIIKIIPGDTIYNLSNKLSLNNTYLKYYIKNNNPDFKLIAGNFKISENANIEQILTDLQTPLIENEINITLLEGWNIYDIDEYLFKKGLIEKNAYINYVTNTEKIKQLTKFFPFLEGLNTLEGYLYPDTYTVISNNFKINVLVIKQLENFENKVYNKILSNIDNKEIKKIINLASIVEKEEKNIAEKATVAGILKKRLENGWMIGADITVCYPHKLTANECKMVISKYINEKSEYNTRTMNGLPKTPIGNPSYETIYATLNSKKTSHWFYLHDTKTGKIYYADSNEGHTINKNRYLR